ncbi:cytochrome c-type biogenesis protein [Nitrogeniibacter mangrovi]|uniref:cytochrome c-type biogenesis protein n=1 Tax=Nitrogeniibacter mangrovi TaxID=2016596 RepID=UPI001E568AFC|nr:cytochrome c-type biogenesis protein [Nitrogeniibacter mangrovi]
MKQLLFAAALVLASASAMARTAEHVVADPALEERVLKLSEKLRCLVCQNQSIAESQADLALDLRDQVREQMAAGKSDEEIVDYLVARYGDFVLYDPPVRTTTLLLWGAPGVLAVLGVGALIVRLKRRNRTSTPHLDDAQRARARALLDGDGTPEADA